MGSGLSLVSPKYSGPHYPGGHPPFKFLKAALATLWDSNTIRHNIHQVRSAAPFPVWRVRHDDWNFFPARVGRAINVGVYLTSSWQAVLSPYYSSAEELTLTPSRMTISTSFSKIMSSSNGMFSGVFCHPRGKMRLSYPKGMVTTLTGLLSSSAGIASCHFHSNPSLGIVPLLYPGHDLSIGILDLVIGKVGQRTAPLICK